MSMLLESVVAGSSADLDGVLPPPVDRKGLGGRGDERGSLSGISGVRFKVSGSDEASSASSSIGAPDDSDGDETGSGGDDDEVQSTLSLNDLDESLPGKKGLSTYYAGRSKSYGNLADVKSANDMEKPDNPFNKRRRNFLAYKLSSWSTSSSSSSPSKRRMGTNDSRSSFYGHGNPISMPFLPVHEQDDEDDDYLDDDGGDDDYLDDDGGTKTGFKRSDLHLGLNGGSRFCI